MINQQFPLKLMNVRSHTVPVLLFSLERLSVNYRGAPSMQSGGAIVKFEVKVE
jgi:hypothetical protein